MARMSALPISDDDLEEPENVIPSAVSLAVPPFRNRILYVLSPLMTVGTDKSDKSRPVRLVPVLLAG